MKTHISKRFAVTTTIGLLVGVLLNIHLYGDPRFSNGALAIKDMVWWEVLVNAGATLLVFANIVVAALDAYFNYRTKWVWLNLLIWPLSFLYIWRRATGIFGNQNDSRTSPPGRANPLLAQRLVARLWLLTLDALNMKKYEPYYPGEGNVSFSNIKRQILGKGSLRDAFWGIWVAGILIIKLFASIAAEIYIHFTENVEVRTFIHNNEGLILLPYMIFAYVVVWRNTICLKRYWVFVARLITTLVLYGTVLNVYKSI